ncbi:MAG: endonuclease/exonuclease/phosphatase family protein [Gemmatimonadota bacterium]|nr:MAG: endonuclease/exonuclease/phosphatase family protein [Gemmatimonadota bacterium]
MSETFPLRVVTFNAWALPVTIPSQEKRRRLSRLPEALAALDADVIVLQELFDVQGRRRLLSELCPPYLSTPDAMESRRILGLAPADTTGGLLVLSRLPITGSRFVSHSLGSGTKVDERLGRKGAMFVHLETPVGALTVFAVHLYAGTKPKDTRIRSAQLAPLLEALDSEAGTNPVLLAGDINTSPTVGYPELPGLGNPYTPEYAALDGAGFVDSLPPNPTPAGLTATWVPSRNRFAALPYQETKTDERYDYVMVRAGASNVWSVGTARTVLDGAGEHLSDHVGVLAELDLILYSA